MKTFINSIIYGFAVGVAYMGGAWLWSEVLEDKAEDLKHRLTKTE